VETGIILPQFERNTFVGVRELSESDSPWRRRTFGATFRSSGSAEVVQINLEFMFVLSPFAAKQARSLGSGRSGNEIGSKEAFPAQRNGSETYFFVLLYPKTQARAGTHCAWRFSFQDVVQIQGTFLFLWARAKSR
jgi:hypothetical protein